MDASVVGTHMMLEAEDLGLGSVWVLLFDPGKVRDAFGIPDHIHPHFILAVGYPAADAAPYRPWHDTFRKMEDIAEEW